MHVVLIIICQQVAVGGSHFAVVTIEKELFTWTVSSFYLVMTVDIMM